MSASTDFEKCLTHVFGNEGGYANVKGDRGGATNMGITAGTLKRANAQGIVTCNDVKLLTRDEAATIYEKLYWRPCKADQMEWPLDLLHFDAAVNHGTGGAAKLLQKAINKIAGTSVSVDGAVGPLTLAALNRLLATGENQRKNLYVFCRVYLDIRRDYFHAIVAKNQTQKKFLRGWLNRCDKLQDVVEREFS